jgi:hypothetical protein
VGACWIAILLFVYVMPLKAQVTAQPDGWRGLIIDVSTPEDAIRIFGQPSSDKSNQSLRLLMVDKWLAGGKYKQKLFRQLTFKKPVGFDEVRLSFLESKLIMIELEPRTGDVPDWFDPDTLAVTFNARFTPQEWHIGKKLPPLTEFQQSMRADPPKKFAEIYDMVAISDRSFILARVDNITARPMGLFTRGCSSCAKEENKKRKERDAGGTFPGQISFVEIISRRLGNDAGIDIQK